MVMDEALSNAAHPIAKGLESGPARFHDGCSRLRSWAYSSLDLYKHELLRVLYPVFIHCLMDLVAKRHIQGARNFFNTFREDHDMLHLRDLQKLEGGLLICRLEMEFAHSLRQSKFNIKIWEYSYELLLQHLHNTQSTTILDLTNEHIDFQGTSLQLLLDNLPGTISDDPEAVMLCGSSQDEANQLLEDMAKPKKGRMKRIRKDQLNEESKVELSILEDLRNRVQLSSVALPSVSFYTFLNTHNGLSCSSISHDGSLVAGGFSDSSLKVWDMAKLGQQTVNCKFVVITCLEQYNMSDCVCLEQYNMSDCVCLEQYNMLIEMGVFYSSVDHSTHFAFASFCDWIGDINHDKILKTQSRDWDFLEVPGQVLILTPLSVFLKVQFFTIKPSTEFFIFILPQASNTNAMPSPHVTSSTCHFSLPSPNEIQSSPVAMFE
ncbi:hypothetical protein K1719_024004 [Acacia pycnantha]|nr:hypothetical protein K1719_024004 [Acacia pycnantha]